jgi:hypothetical protein
MPYGQDLTAKWLKLFLPTTPLLVNYRPDWPQKLGLDFYYQDLRVGIEFQEHYTPTSSQKIKLCHLNNVGLVKVTPFDLRKLKLMNRIYNRIRKLSRWYGKVKLPPVSLNDPQSVTLESKGQEYVKQLRNLPRKKSTRAIGNYINRQPNTILYNRFEKWIRTHPEGTYEDFLIHARNSIPTPNLL